MGFLLYGMALEPADREKHDKSKGLTDYIIISSYHHEILCLIYKLTNLLFLKRLLDLFQISQQTDISANLQQKRRKF